MQKFSSEGEFGWFEGDSKERSETTGSGSDDSDGERYEINHPSTSYFKRFTQSKPSQVDSSLGAKVLFVFDNVISALSCRSFENLMSGHAYNTQIWVAVSAFRIIQDREGVRAEFKVMMILDDEVTTIWRRFSDFVQLAQLHGIPTGPLRNLLTQSSFITKAHYIWNEIEARKPWFRSTSIKYLVWKCVKLEDFLKNLLFEAADPDRLIRFVNGGLA